MVLRNRQLRGIPLSWWQGIVGTLFVACTIPFIAENFWFKLLPFIPDTIRRELIYIGMILYIGQCSGNVKAGTEQAQQSFGSYSGISFPAGFYLLPRVPFPIISLFLHIAFGAKVYKYFGWILEGVVQVESITSPFVAEGLTSDNIRVKLSGTLVFEIENAAVYLSQTRDGSDRSAILEALPSEFSSRIKKNIIARHTSEELYKGEHTNDEKLTELITRESRFVKDFGLSLSRALFVLVDIQSERIKKAFDADNSKVLLRRNTNEVAEAFSEFRKGLPPETSDEVAFLLFNAARLDENLPTVTLANLKVK